jgi:hypothetical protein
MTFDPASLIITHKENSVNVTDKEIVLVAYSTNRLTSFNQTIYLTGTNLPPILTMEPSYTVHLGAYKKIINVTYFDREEDPNFKVTVRVPK